MANDQHVNLLMRGSLIWNDWRKENADTKPDFTNVTLRKEDLGGANLSGANLVGADLVGADLVGANLSGANLVGANLAGANLVEADLREADLREANLAWANVGGANFGGAILSRAILSDLDLSGRFLVQANLDEADLREANLSGAILSRAILSRASLAGANLVGANLVGANLGGANLGGATLSEADLREANLGEADLREANLRGASLVQVNLSGANLSGADLREVRVSGVLWDRSRMRGRYLGIRGLDSCFGNALFRRAAADQDFLDTLEMHWRGTWRMWLFRAWSLLDFGRSMSRAAAFGFGVAVFYGVVFSVWRDILNYHGSANTWFTPFYFSIVTFTTLGLGDVTPSGIVGEILASSEVVVGYITLGLLLAVLAEKLARRS